LGIGRFVSRAVAEDWQRRSPPGRGRLPRLGSGVTFAELTVSILDLSCRSILVVDAPDAATSTPVGECHGVGSHCGRPVFFN